VEDVETNKIKILTVDTEVPARPYRREEKYTD
jgi:hypothetical protein